MNLLKAIEIKTLWREGGEIPSALDYQEADKLSIEALKKWKDLKALGAYYVGGLLPGETEE